MNKTFSSVSSKLSMHDVNSKLYKRSIRQKHYLTAIFFSLNVLCVTALTLDTTKISLGRTTNSSLITSGDDAVRMRCLKLQLFLYCPIFAFAGYIESLSSILNPILFASFPIKTKKHESFSP